MDVRSISHLVVDAQPNNLQKVGEICVGCQLKPMILQHMTISHCGHRGEARAWSSSTGSSICNLQVIFLHAGCNRPDVLAILVCKIIS